MRGRNYHFGMFSTKLPAAWSALPALFFMLFIFGFFLTIRPPIMPIAAPAAKPIAAPFTVPFIKRPPSVVSFVFFAENTSDMPKEAGENIVFLLKNGVDVRRSFVLFEKLFAEYRKQPDGDREHAKRDSGGDASVDEALDRAADRRDREHRVDYGIRFVFCFHIAPPGIDGNILPYRKEKCNRK